MPSGGYRPGAGRKRGAVNRMSAEAREKAKETGVLPLDYMLAVMRNIRAPSTRRDDMAKAAAPFLHPKLTAVQVSGPNGGPVQLDMGKLSDADLDAVEGIVRKASVAGADRGGETPSTD